MNINSLTESDREQWHVTAFGISARDITAYKAQKDSAKRRGIEFRFTLLEWAIWWRQHLPAGSRRGRLRDNYVMARIGDAGAYEPGNVVAKTPAGNAADRKRSVRHGKARGGPKGPCRGSVGPVMTEVGLFASAAQAAEHYGITRQAAAYRARTERSGWYYVARRRCLRSSLLRDQC